MFRTRWCCLVVEAVMGRCRDLGGKVAVSLLIPQAASMCPAEEEATRRGEGLFQLPKER